MLTVCRFQSEQAGRALISYVVASSVGNISISNLTEPVQIEIAHLSDQVDARPAPVFGCHSSMDHFIGLVFVWQVVLSPVCMFWDFSMSGESLHLLLKADY